ncbi:MAG TPA: hypothetical protein VMV11_05775 [Acidimicrobiales bacterium]|nr:hypothetical protein [Acidimicrobiales bacterium]
MVKLWNKVERCEDLREVLTSSPVVDVRDALARVVVTGAFVLKLIAIDIAVRLTGRATLRASSTRAPTN